MTDKLQKAIALIKSGDQQKGTDLLNEILRAQPNNESAWLWMSGVVPDDEQRLYCLHKVLTINPDNQAAKKGLASIQRDRKTEPVEPSSQPASSYLEAQSRPAYVPSPVTEPAAIAQQDRPGDALELTELHCKNCGAPIKEDDINLDLAMARCSYCGAVFSVKGLPLQEDREAPLRYERPSVPMPKGIEMANVGNVLRISRRWFRWLHIFLLLWCLGWDGFLIVWHGMAIASGMWPMLLFALLHTAVGIAMTYYVLAGFLNRTTVQVGKGMFEVWHHPLPWFGEKHLQATDIKQIYCKENIRRSSDGVSKSYEVYAVLRHGGKEKLLSGLIEPEQALYIEQELERFLGIQNRPVRGEIPC